MESQRRMLDRRVKSSGPWPAAGGLDYKTMFLGCLNVPSFRYASGISLLLAQRWVRGPPGVPEGATKGTLLHFYFIF